MSALEKHVLREAVSPPDARVWTMWCGAQTFAPDGGNLAPAIDFLLEADAEWATCAGCRGLLDGLPRGAVLSTRAQGVLGLPLTFQDELERWRHEVAMAVLAPDGPREPEGIYSSPMVGLRALRAGRGA